MEKKSPLISIVTVVYNAADLLVKTMESVRAQIQQYPHIEYIVVDGASKDGTLEVIQENEDIVSKWISEPDKGIYDAMNKGLSMCSGTFVWFLNAGDFIYSHRFLSDVFGEEACRDGNTLGSAGDGWADIYYGQTQLVDSEWHPAGMRRLRAPEKLTARSFRWGMLVCHQSILVRRSLTIPYDCRYKCSADFNWVLFALEKAVDAVYTGQIMACYLKGGKSRKMLLLSWRERFQIMCKHFGVFPTLWFHGLIVLRALVPRRLLAGKQSG